MLKKLVCVVAVLAICLGAAVADTIKGAKITKIDGTKITVEYKEKKEAKTAVVDVKDAKVVAGKDKTPVDGGVSSLKVDQVVTLEVTDGKATEVIVSKKK
jgi:hypothetical protein